MRKEAATRPSWRDFGEQLLPSKTLDEIRSRLDEAQRIEIRVPVRVRPKGRGTAESMSYFTVYIEKCRDSGSRPVFLRDGIVISDIRCPQISGIRSLVDVAEPALAGLLGDSEGVNHTQWQKDSPKFHNRYTYGPDTIKFVTRSVYEIMQRLHGAEKKGDPTLLLDIFYLPVDETPAGPAKSPIDKKTGTLSALIPDIPVDNLRRFRLERDKDKGGFLLLPGGALLNYFPVRVRIEAGYAVRRGNAFKRWTLDDFAFIRPPLKKDEDSNVTVVQADGNCIVLDIYKPNFRFAISGFDTRRDLVVRAYELRGQNEEDV